MGKLDLAAAMHGSIGSASTVSMELTEKRTLDQIAADIVRKDQQVGLGLISIGNDLIEAKEQVEHGKWREWLDLNCGYSERKAQFCMQVARRYGSNPQRVADLGVRKVTALMMLPAGEEEAFLAEHDVADMTSDELKTAIRERDEARAALRQSEEAIKSSRFVNEQLKSELDEIKKKPKTVYQDEAAIQKAAEAAREETRRELQRELDAARDEAAKALARANQAGRPGSDREMADFLGAEIETTSNRLYGILLKAVNQDADAETAKRIRALFAALSGKFAAFAKFGRTNEEAEA